MKLTTLTMFLSFILSLSSFARKPAVEDFVGVEPSPEFELSEVTKPAKVDTTVKFNYGNHVKALPGTNTVETSQSFPTWFSIVGLFAFITLPFMMWFGITKNVTSEISKTNDLDFESAQPENVTNLEDYKQTDSIDKKAS